MRTGELAALVLVLCLTDMRCCDLAGVQVGDLITVRGRGLRLQWTVLASNYGGQLYVDALNKSRARTVDAPVEIEPMTYALRELLVTVAHLGFQAEPLLRAGKEILLISRRFGSGLLGRVPHVCPRA